MRSAPDGDARRSARPTGGRAVRGARTGTIALAAFADAVCVLGLAVGGVAGPAPRADPVGPLSATWPFLVAAAVGWCVSRAWRSPWRLWPTGVVVWGCTWALGVVLRVLADRGVFPTFQIVSFGFLAVTMLGWRGVVAIVRILRPSRPRVIVQMDDHDGPPR
ncbi:DUF3054 domain-containing protein [Isoptericola sp. NPDC056618]|uniref:DUF3054 domain-containing protein n=1 Tax=unclassified Isoptericola TaxID=2623355 RepID=UPI00366875CD